MTRFVPQVLAMAAVTILTVATTGCVPVVVGGAAVGATAVAQERGIDAAVDDSLIQAAIDRQLFEFDTTLFQRVGVEVVEGRVLLTGLVPEPQNRVDAARIAWQAEGVKEVINEIEVSDKSTLSDAATDSFISVQLRGRIAGDSEIRSINYTIETVNRTIYLMGVAQSQQELDRVIAHARGIDYVRRVVPYVRIKDVEPAPAPASGGGG